MKPWVRFVVFGGFCATMAVLCTFTGAAIADIHHIDEQIKAMKEVEEELKRLAV